MNDFERRVTEQGEESLLGMDLAGLVVSVTLRCNQACVHCHVDGSPSRSETMSAEVMGKAASSVLLGTQPRQVHSPPSRPGSTRATRAPRPRATSAAVRPAEPEPSTTRSNPASCTRPPPS